MQRPKKTRKVCRRTSPTSCLDRELETLFREEKLNSVTAQDSSECPELTLLIELVQETLAEDWVEATSHHLERCQRCQMKIERWLDGSDGEKSGVGLIPGYELGIELGRGGMGVVYQATRQATVK